MKAALMYALCLCMYTRAGTHKDQKRVGFPGAQAAVSCHVGEGTRTQVLHKSSQRSNC